MHATFPMALRHIWVCHLFCILVHTSTLAKQSEVSDNYSIPFRIRTLLWMAINGVLGVVWTVMDHSMELVTHICQILLQRLIYVGFDM